MEALLLEKPKRQVSQRFLIYDLLEAQNSNFLEAQNSNFYMIYSTIYCDE